AGRLTPGELQLFASQNHRRRSELRDADLERRACPGRRPREQDRDALPQERLGAVRGARLEIASAFDQGEQLLALKLRSGDEGARLAHGGILVALLELRVLSWNVFHGRDHPPDPTLYTWRSRLFGTRERGAVYAQVNRSLLDEFASTIAGAEWSVCLLQEMPPAWAPAIAKRAESEAHLVLTSRNQL